MATPALFLDRDGVINHEKGYMYKIEDAVFMDGLFDLCRAAHARGMKIVVVTNQAGIGRGYYTEEQFHELMDWMRAELRRQGTDFDGVYYCPFHPVHGQGKYMMESDERKPGPGMLTRAAREMDLDLSRSLIVGDRCTDIAAAVGAGVPQRFLLAGTETAHCTAGEHAVVSSHAEVQAWIEAHYPVLETA